MTKFISKAVINPIARWHSSAGIRSIQLTNGLGEPLELAALVVHISIRQCARTQSQASLKNTANNEKVAAVTDDEAITDESEELNGRCVGQDSLYM